MTIRISQDVYDAIAARGAFGETPDDVLRRAFDLAPRAAARRGRRGSVRLTDLDGLPLGIATVVGDKDPRLVVKLRGAPVAMWRLAGLDGAGRAEVRRAAVDFARQHGVGRPEALIDRALAAAGGSSQAEG